jgi:hemoglobin
LAAGRKAVSKVPDMDVLEMRRRVNEGDVSTLVERFYELAQGDPVLGPVFASRIADDAWPQHLAKMKAFWSTVLLGTAKYRGDPMTAHRLIAGIHREHFARWLALFEEILHDVFATDVAGAIVQRARRMGDSLIASLRL